MEITEFINQLKTEHGAALDMVGRPSHTPVLRIYCGTRGKRGAEQDRMAYQIRKAAKAAGRYVHINKLAGAVLVTVR